MIYLYLYITVLVILLWHLPIILFIDLIRKRSFNFIYLKKAFKLRFIGSLCVFILMFFMFKDEYINDPYCINYWGEFFTTVAVFPMFMSDYYAQK